MHFYYHVNEPSHDGRGIHRIVDAASGKKEGKTQKQTHSQLPMILAFIQILLGESANGIACFSPWPERL